MRRGTEPAIEMGLFLKTLREDKEWSIREVARRMGVPAATVSQTEKGQRALKKPKIGMWAKALEFDEDRLTHIWLELDAKDVPPIVRRRAAQIADLDLMDKIRGLTANQKTLVEGYIDGLLAQAK